MIGIAIANSLGFTGPSVLPDASAQAYFAATGITGTTQQAAINNLIKGLKTDGIWSKMKAVYPFVTDNRNVLSYTDTFSNGYWTKDGVTITAGQTDPTGGSNATRVVGTTPSRSLFGLVTLTTGATYTLSCFVKSTSGSNQTFRIYANGGSPFSSNLTATSTWQQVTLTFTAIAGTNSFGITRDTSSNNYDILVYGIQMELGSTATTYQPIATTQQAYIASQFKFNLVNPVDSDAAFRLVFNGGWTHSSTGATPNGTNGFANTYLVPNTELSAHSIHLSYYSRTQNTTQQDSQIGSSNTGYSNQYTIDLYYAGGVNAKVFVAGSYPGNSISNPNTDTLGYMIGTRTANNVAKMFMDGSQIGSTLTTTYTGGFSTSSIYIGAQNNGGTAVEFGSKQSAFASIGDGLTDTEAANLYTRVQTFNQALGRQVGVPIVSDADAQAFLNSAEITDLTQANAINTLVTDLKAQGLWTKMKAIYPFVGGTASTHKWNLKDPRDLDAAYRLVFNGGWTHSSTGATPNGTNGYADTKLIPSSVLTTSSAHFSKYNRTNDLVNFKLDGSYTVSNSTLFQHNYTAANGCIGQSTSTATYTATNTQGLFTATRIATDAFKVFKNTSNIASNTTSITAMPNSSVYIGARNEDGVSPGFYNSYQAAFASIGDGLSDSEAAALYTAVQTYQTTLSRQV
jgi:hypothetical protein